MKITKQESDYFQPITLEITIESREELEDLLARVNASPVRINEGHDGFQADGLSTKDLYDLLYHEWSQRGYHAFGGNR
jgi:hypothetical protein